MTAPVPAGTARWALARALAVLMGALGALYAGWLALAFAPGAQWRAALCGLIAFGMCAALFAALLAGPGRWQPLRAAVAAMLSVPCGAFLAAMLVLGSDPDPSAWPLPREGAELSMFVMRFSVVHLGVVTLPVAAGAGWLASRWRGVR